VLNVKFQSLFLNCALRGMDNSNNSNAILLILGTLHFVI
jgi:hypothetical protein